MGGVYFNTHASVHELRRRLRKGPGGYIAVDPEGAAQRHKAARRDRRVSISEEHDGMASLWALLSAPDAQSCYQWLTRLAHGYGTTDPRGIDARRADLLVDLLTGRLTWAAPNTDTDSQDDTESEPEPGAESDAGAEADTKATDTKATGPATDDEPDHEAAAPAATATTVPGPGPAVVQVPAATIVRAPTARPASARRPGPTPGATTRLGSTPARRLTSTKTRPPAPPPRPPQPRDPRSGAAGCRRARAPGADPAQPGGSPPRPVNPGKPLVQVFMPFTTLIGKDDQPCELVGHGPIPADLAREIAADATLTRLVYDPLSGTLLDHGRTTYRPPAGLADHIRARDVHCREPNCRRRALDGHLDHVVPYPDGPTNDKNLHGCCGHHHRMKHAPGWAVRALPDGRIQWITPTGHRYHSHPYDYRTDNDLPPDKAPATGTCPKTWPHDWNASNATAASPNSGTAKPSHPTTRTNRHPSDPASSGRSAGVPFTGFRSRSACSPPAAVVRAGLDSARAPCP